MYLTCHVTTLPRYHVVKLFCGRRFATLFALCVSTGGVVLSYFAVEDFAVVVVLIPHPPATPAADR